MSQNDNQGSEDPRQAQEHVRNVQENRDALEDQARRVAALERIRNRMQRDIELKRALGYPDAVLTRAPQVLANLDRWIPRASAAAD